MGHRTQKRVDCAGVAGMRYSDAELLEELGAFVWWSRRGARRVHRGEGRTGGRRYGRGLGVREFAAWPGRRRSQNTYIRRFGSWREAMARVGVEGVRARKYGAEELVREAERVWRALGRRPGETTLPRMGRFSLNAYKRRWGSPEKLCALIAAERRGEITRERVLAGVAGAGRRKTIPAHVRWAVVQRDGHRCVGCGASPATRAGVELQIDHIVPVALGGGNEITNLRTLCGECNAGRGVETLREVRRGKGRKRRGVRGIGVGSGRARRRRRGTGFV